MILITSLSSLVAMEKLELAFVKSPMNVVPSGDFVEKE